MKPRLLQRYIVFEFIPPFAVALGVCTFLLVLNHILDLMDLFLNRGVGLALIFKMLSLILPMFLPLSLPIAALLAAFLAYGRLSEDGELTALRSAGLTVFQYSWPNLALGLAMSFFLVQFNMNAAPRAAREFRNIHYAVAQKNPLALFAPKVMNHFGDYKVIVEKMDRRKRRISGVTVYKMNREGSPTRILAPEGEVSAVPGGGLVIELANGAIHQPSADRESQYTITKFNRFALRVPAEMSDEPKSASVREMSVGDLRSGIDESLKKNVSAAPLLTEQNLRIAAGFTPFVFVALGIALGVKLKKGSRSAGIGMSLVVVALYYGLLLLSVSLSNQGAAPAVLLTWVPNAAALAAGAALWRRLAKQ
ncbi:MAG: hypothetical protein A2636_01505 [Elusimicrobia bacterium RIFCSPHIGHO2_01_FULL_64_10]|nr:MAG: hypothetical protein A2636_01505 [Elusimicrobia bacterium RIFCSPHIGHO2_01_FULL_64_10]